MWVISSSSLCTKFQSSQPFSQLISSKILSFSMSTKYSYVPYVLIFSALLRHEFTCCVMAFVWKYLRRIWFLRSTTSCSADSISKGVIHCFSSVPAKANWWWKIGPISPKTVTMSMVSHRILLFVFNLIPFSSSSLLINYRLRFRKFEKLCKNILMYYKKKSIF